MSFRIPIYNSPLPDSLHLAVERINAMRQSLEQANATECFFRGVPLEKFDKEQLVFLLKWKFGQSEFGRMPKEADEPIVVKS